MKNYDLLKIIASKLNGYGYRMEIPKEHIEFCKENGIVICYGASDDLMELDGAIYDEYGCYDGGTICIDEKGNEDADANVYYPITAVWGRDNISWQYEFEPRHEVFTIYEDGEIYCKGIVFFVDDLKRSEKCADAPDHVVVLPCAIGDPVWVVCRDLHDYVLIKGFCCGFHIDENGIRIITNVSCYDNDRMGNYVNENEAKKRLAELKGEGT